MTILLYALAAVGMALSAPASAATVIAGCTIVANPTPTTHTNCAAVNLSGANLSGLNLAHANLSGSNLKNADLTGANLSSSSLTNANLAGANLAGADLAGANLSGANLSGSHLGSANFSGANVTGANLKAFFVATLMPNGSTNSAGSTITAGPATASAPNGLTQAFSATGHYSDGTSVVLTDNVTWSSSNTAVATVSQAGSAKGVVPNDPYSAANFPRSATITATAGAASGGASLTVVAPNLASIAVTPASPTIEVGGTKQFTATATYTDASTQDITSTATWASVLPATATVSTAGVATGVATGTASITASSGTISSPAATLTVDAPMTVQIGCDDCSSDILVPPNTGINVAEGSEDFDFQAVVTNAPPGGVSYSWRLDTPGAQDFLFNPVQSTSSVFIPANAVPDFVPAACRLTLVVTPNDGAPAVSTEAAIQYRNSDVLIGSATAIGAAGPNVSPVASANTITASQSVTINQTIVNNTSLFGGVTPQGNVTYTTGGTLLGSAPLGGFDISGATLGVGTHTITATYYIWNGIAWAPFSRDVTVTVTP